jgi:hypothetical protein
MKSSLLVPGFDGGRAFPTHLLSSVTGISCVAMRDMRRPA